MTKNLGRTRRWANRGTISERIERTAERLQRRGVDTLSASVAAVEEHAPLPRCEHGNPLMDHCGERLEPSCGCRTVPGRYR